MADASFLQWPFLEDRHRKLSAQVERFARVNASDKEREDVDAQVRRYVKALGDEGLLKHATGNSGAGFDVRSLCVIRETLARHDGLLDFSFAMQGLGSAPIVLHGSDELKSEYLPPVTSGQSVTAFALSEAAAGSNVAAIATTARRDGDDYVLDGEKTWISNAGVADYFVVFARTGEGEGHKGLSAFVVESGKTGFAVSERFDVTAPHPIGTLRFDGCRVPAGAMVGNAGDGFKVAMSTLDVFRSTVGAAALGFARRALDEAVSRSRARVVFDQSLGDFQMTKDRIATMATDVDASALMVYRGAWATDTADGRATREAAMAKLYATEAAQKVIDSAVQLFGGAGVVKGNIVESLYREIRPLRIYEGTSEIQKLIIARELLDK